MAQPPLPDREQPIWRRNTPTRENTMYMSSQITQQLDRALEHVRAGTPIGEVCRTFGVSEVTLVDRQQSMHGTPTVAPESLAEAQREIRRLRRQIASLTADKCALVEALVRGW